MKKKQLLIIGGIVVGVILLTACEKNSGEAVGTNKDTSQQAANMQVSMKRVPAGEFTMGSNKVDNEGMQDRYGFPAPLYLNEHPERKVTIAAFDIDEFETTNTQYKQFLLKSSAGERGKVPVAWGTNGYGLAPSQMKSMKIETLRMIAADHFKLGMDTQKMTREALTIEMLAAQKIADMKPVTGVTWVDAKKYCIWRGAKLPTEQQWEKAARGTDGREFPWGNNWDPKITNTGNDAAEEEGIVAVGTFPKNASPYGAFDMSGNVWEWTDDWYDAIPGSNYHDPEYGKKNMTIRGGSGGMGHYAISYFYRNATRQYAPANTMAEDIGFRCVKDI